MSASVADSKQNNGEQQKQLSNNSNRSSYVHLFAGG